MLKNPANRHRAVGFTHEQWHYAFTNTFSEEESRALYERYAIPASGKIFWGSALANIHPGHQDTWVDYNNDDRAPLLFISGSEDHLMPPKIQRSNAKHYKSDTVTEVKEFEGRAHLLPAQEGWEEVADYALDVGGRARGQPAPRERRPPHPHRRADGPDRGRRLAAADRSDVRPARPALPLRLGHRLAQAAGPGGRRRATSDRSTRSCSATTTTTTTSTTPGARCCRRRASSSPPHPAPSAWAAALAGSSRGRPRGSRRPGGRRSRSPRRRAATARR